MINGNGIKVSGTVIFRAILLITNLAMVSGMLWIRVEIRKELGGYVTKSEFQTYQEAHTKWGDEVIKGIRASTDENTHRLDRIEAKLDRMIERGK